MDKSTLLIIDVQNGFINEYTQHIPAFVERAQAEYGVVWAAQLVYGEQSPFLTIRKRSGFADVKNPTDFAFQLSEGAKIITKHGYSAVTEELLSDLRARNVTQIDLMGVDTDQCVMATALNLFDAGIAPRIIRDGCASTGGLELQAAAMRILARALGEHTIN